MTNISQKEKNSIIRYAAHILSLCEEGMDAKAVLSRAYQKSMTDKTPRDGEAFAEELLGQMAEFQACYELNLEEPETGVMIYLKHLTEGLPLKEQCRLLHNMAAGAQILEQQDGADAAAYTGECSEEARDGLFYKAAAALKTKHPEELPLSEDAKLYTELKGKISDEFFIALTAAILYFMSKKGELENCPKTLTLEQAVTCVYEDVSLWETASLLEQKEIGREEALRRKEALRKTAKLLLLAASFTGAIFSGLFLLNFSAALQALRAAMASGRKMTGHTAPIAMDMIHEEEGFLARVKALRPYGISTDVTFPPLLEEMDGEMALPEEAVLEAEHWEEEDLDI